MNNDGDVDTDEDNCDLDYRAAGNLILKTTKAKVYLQQSIHSMFFSPCANERFYNFGSEQEILTLSGSQIPFCRHFFCKKTRLEKDEDEVRASRQNNSALTTGCRPFTEEAV
ncbi:hypothetical protein ALC57_11243 [Trachymyrmex cornetzi]|uniref:Uncharacterized protein n=1 Tax=Trachymyrmex cornetzi TaxID=471704 RepID=A0A195DVC9_9HYME|nr:hypothetical protein ALC57_11243 [Trachymyrmex cornetzi]